MSMVLLENPLVSPRAEVSDLFWKDLSLIGGLIYLLH